MYAINSIVFFLFLVFLYFRTNYYQERIREKDKWAKEAVNIVDYFDNLHHVILFAFRREESNSKIYVLIDAACRADDILITKRPYYVLESYVNDKNYKEVENKRLFLMSVLPNRFELSSPAEPFIKWEKYYEEIAHRVSGELEEFL